MKSMSDLRRRYVSERRNQIFDALPRFAHDGLRLGRGTLLARIGSGETSRFDEDGDRLTVLLSAAHRRQASPLVLKYAQRAAGHWSRGDAALAHIELAFARLPRLEDDDAFRLFLAEVLLDDGLTPHGLARELGLDLLKYDPDQPRVPAGSGRQSGRLVRGLGRQRLSRTLGHRSHHAEKGAADMARERFEEEGLDRIVIGTMPPSRRR